MFAAHRRERILELLQQHKEVLVKELALLFQVSEGTLRTDLRILEDEGLLERTHGGAIAINRYSAYASREQDASTRSHLNANEKKAIAERAAGLVKQGQTLLLDASSTVLELARILAGQDFLTVVTNGIEAALVLNRNPRINVILLGGVLRSSSKTVEGLLGLSLLKDIQADYFFTSAEGFSIQEGMTDFSLQEAELKKRMAARANRIVALVDHTKLGRRSIATSVEAKEIAIFITDTKADGSILRSFGGMQVWIAEHR